ncbi:MAG: hypothetical protein OHK0024_14070 [Thalassobaculales bacterium]
MRALALCLMLLAGACATPGPQPPPPFLVFFAPASAALDEPGLAVLDRAAAAAKAGGDLLVVGHTSADGTRTANDILSQRRVQAVLRRLAELGVPPERVTWRARGEEEAGLDPDGDRRVEIRVGL